MQSKHDAGIALFSRFEAIPDTSDKMCFPALSDHLTGCTAIGLASVLAGRRLKLGARVLTGSWRHEDGTVTNRYSRWVEYTRIVEGQPMDGIALIPETEYAVVLTFEQFAERKRIA